MTWSLRPIAARGIVPIATVLSLLAVTAGPASAAKAPAHTAISAHLTASTVPVKSTATITGTVAPAGGTLALQRLVGKVWTTVGHAKPSRTGAYVLSVRAAKTASTWSLKVVRAGSKTAKAGTSGTLHLHVVTKQFAVAAAAADTVTAPAATDVTGVVIPATGGTVVLQSLQGKTWVAIGTGKLSGGAFAIRITLPVGAHQLRVVKAFTSTVAQGASSAFSILVSAPPVLSPPTVTTAAIPVARVGEPYATVLTASGGSGFYQWAGTGLPAGLTVSAAGLLAGTPTTQGTATLTATVTDSAGHSASASLTLTIAPPAGRLFAVGDNAGGELGNGGSANESTIVPVIGMTSVTSAAAGTFAAIAARADGSVWTWGYGTDGELGTGSTTPSAVPVHVPSISGVVAVAEGSQTSYALKADGTVWAWGGNAEGQVGDGTQTNRPTPVQVSVLTSVVAISTAATTAYALRSDGTVWAWGHNQDGQLGDGTTNDRATPAQIAGLTGIKQIASATHSGYALRSDGTVAAWGSDTFDDLGDGAPAAMQTHPVTVNTISQVTQLVGGLDSAYALTAGGTLFGWGSNAQSELGGATANATSDPVVIRSGVIRVGAGMGAGYAVLSDRTAVSWGRNSAGELGNGATTTGTTPAAMTGVVDAQAVVSGGFADTVLVIAG